MELSEMIQCLYEKDTKLAYDNLKDLEALSDHEPSLYPFLQDFLGMLKSERYVIRVRGFRLICRQAKWDKCNLIDQSIDEILRALDDEKPTAVRQALKALENVAIYKKALHSKIAEKAQSIDYLSYKDTMHSLLQKDIKSLMNVIASQTEDTAAK